MGLWGDIKKFAKKGYEGADKGVWGGFLPGGVEAGSEGTSLFGVVPTGPQGVTLSREIKQGYLNPQSTEAYAAAAAEAAARSAEQRAATAGAYADRGLGQSGWATAANQQVGMNQQRALGDAIQDIQARYLAAALGLREQDLGMQASREQAIAGVASGLLGGAGKLAGAGMGV